MTCGDHNFRLKSIHKFSTLRAIIASLVIGIGLLISALFTNTLLTPTFSAPPPENSKAVARDDLNRNQALAQYVRSLQKWGIYGFIQVHYPIYQLQSEKFSALFPDIRIYYVRLKNFDSPFVTGHLLSLNPGRMIVQDKQGQVEGLDFGKMVVKQKVKLDSLETARNLWDVYISLRNFNHLYRSSTIEKEKPSERVGEHEWHLGIYKTPKGRSYIKVVTDDSNAITSWSYVQTTDSGSSFEERITDGESGTIRTLDYYPDGQLKRERKVLWYENGAQTTIDRLYDEEGHFQEFRAETGGGIKR